MSTKPDFTKMFCTFILASGLIASTVAYAAEPWECDLYAKKAVAQSQANHEYFCPGKYPRFKIDYQHHYSWCLGTQAEVLAHENRARVVEMGSCTASKWDREADAYCTSYAQRAVTQAKMALQNSCGFSGPRWDVDFAMHYKWCMRTNGKVPEYEMNTRRNGLKSCTGGAIVIPPYAPVNSGDLAVVDWCWEDVGNETLFNAIVRNSGSSVWLSTQDAVLKVGLSRPGNITETSHLIPFVDLWGLTPGKTRILRGPSLKYITPATYPTADALLKHNQDTNFSNQTFHVSFGTQYVSDFYTKYQNKRCNLFQHY